MSDNFMLYNMRELELEVEKRKVFFWLTDQIHKKDFLSDVIFS